MAFLRRSCITATPHRVPCRILDTRSNSAADRGHVAIGNLPLPQNTADSQLRASREKNLALLDLRNCADCLAVCAAGRRSLRFWEIFSFSFFSWGEVKRLREFFLGIRRRDSKKRMVERLFLAFEYGCRGSASFSKGMWKSKDVQGASSIIE